MTGLCSDADQIAAQKLAGTKRQEQCSHATHYAHIPRDRCCPSTPLEATGSPTNHARRPRGSPLQAPSDPRQRSRRQSIHIGRALGGGFVQSIFSSPPRRSPFKCFPSVSRRVAELKILCIILSTGLCAVKVGNGLVVPLSRHSGGHNQRLARKARS
jgi:hypothetical protein